jgi:hypothetical protein
MNWTGKRPRKNKANFPIADCGLGISDWGLGERPAASGLLKATAPNKPNFGTGRRKGKCCVDNELRRMGHGRGREKTKPILRFRIADCGLRIGGQTCRLRPAQGDCAKQTKFGSRAGLPCTERLAASPRLRGDDVAANRASAPNKPNFGTTQTKANCGWRKEL